MAFGGVIGASDTSCRIRRAVLALGCFGLLAYLTAATAVPKRVVVPDLPAGPNEDGAIGRRAATAVAAGDPLCRLEHRWLGPRHAAILGR